MKVTLIDYTGSGHPDPCQYAARLLVYTKNTRLAQGEDTRAKIEAMPWPEVLDELDYIANTVRSSWEFIDYTFEISGVTRAFTHQLVRTRTASYAQQSQRSVDMTGGISVTRPETIRDDGRRELWEAVVSMIENGYAKLIEMGVPAQDARGLLPTNIQTNIIMKANLRTLADLVGKRINPRAQGEYTEFMKLTAKAILDVHPWAGGFLFPERVATPALDRLMKEFLGDDTPFSREEVNTALKEIDKLKGVWG
jgi:flavin-dependent thymidylate synthase